MYLKSKLFIVLFLAINSFSFGQSEEGTLTKIGDKLPSFIFETEKGKTVKIEDYKGKLILINLFATWCPPCNAELPLVQKKIWEKYSNNPNFSLFVFGREENWDKVSAFKQRKGFTFPILPDETRNVYKLFATQYIPRNILIDKDGKIIYQSMGYKEDEFEKLVSIIDEKLK